MTVTRHILTQLKPAGQIFYKEILYGISRQQSKLLMQLMDNYPDVISTYGILPLRLKKTPKSDNLYLCRVYLPLQHRSTIIHHLSWSPSRSKSTAPTTNIAILNNTIPYFVTSYCTLYCNYGLYIEVTFSYMVVRRIG